MSQRNSLDPQQEWQAFWLALGFLSRLPMLVKIDYSQSLMNKSSLYFPLVGLLLGALYAASYSLLALFWPPLVCLLLVLALHLCLTGAFHEDGLADSLDGLGGGLTVERRLAIMKDSRIGSYGSAGLFVTLALKVALLLALPTIWLGLLLAPCVARLTPLLLMRTLAYVSDSEQSKSKPVADTLSSQRLLAASLITLFACLLLSPWGEALLLKAGLAIALVSLLWGRTLVRCLGGYSGDTLGASVIFTELLFLLLLAGSW